MLVVGSVEKIGPNQLDWEPDKRSIQFSQKANRRMNQSNLVKNKQNQFEFF